jgi:hypothetical protein
MEQERGRSTEANIEIKFSIPIMVPLSSNSNGFMYLEDNLHFVDPYVILH